ncbi:hypothetical protein [Cohnella sp. JJ-181]|uniref:hypothetical protein n=1 Tax=Cohnella rhizoplanae TaxID=2974897 RepID=UPI0022FF7102|nr:hypothetical protein [Cohnella sp. JJ-181]CAI6032401.1 hypothetical protein COHCIP112018_00756 [Cohnella sp. JJ-181]
MSHSPFDGRATLEPEEWDWRTLTSDSELQPAVARTLRQIASDDRRADAGELRWLLNGIRRELDFYRKIYPDAPFEQELAAAFSRQLESLDLRASAFVDDPGACAWDAYLTLKYEVRKLYKQLGGIVSGSDWQTPAKQLHAGEQVTADESGYAQEEEGTYQRCYGSEAVKRYEDEAMDAFYAMPAHIRERSAIYLTGSGMKALELALAAYKTFAGEDLPCYVQAGFYGEGESLSKTLLSNVKRASPDEMYKLLREGQPVGCLIVDPGQCWPIRQPVDLGALFEALKLHEQRQPLYVIVDRTLTSVANPIFERYADRLPAHVVLVCVESGIKYLQYGFDLVNVGYLVACGHALAEETHRERWVELLSILDAGASPLDVRQLPEPDRSTIITRLSRLNRNAHWMDAYLQYLRRQGDILGYDRSVDPSDAYILEGRTWIGSVFYVRLHGDLSEQEYQERIDACVSASPPEMHLISGGSFGFDSLRLNAVHGEAPEENALRLSVGRAPLDQLLATFQVLARLLLHRSSSRE